ncbi:MAG: hypothetical protein ACRCTZ_17445, partial [Sarcina sp.]
DFNFAMNEVKKEFDRRGEKINPIEQIKIANKLIDNLKARKINYHITENEIISECKDYKVVMKHNGFFSENTGLDAVIDLFNEEMINNIQSDSPIEQQSFASEIGAEVITILLNILYIMSNNKTQYEIVENESTKVKTSSKKKSKSNKKNVTYIKHKDINIVKKKYINSSEKNNSYEYRIDSWVTRGHWRTYKSGKKVWIKERVNNVNKSNSKDISKTYEII